MIEREIDIYAANMLMRRIAVQQGRDPTTDKDKRILVLAEQMNELDQYGFARVYFSLVVVLPCDHIFSRTSFRMNSAASSPLPL